MLPIAPVVYLIVVTWSILQSNRRWMTLLWIILGLAVTLGVFAGLAAVWPDRAGVLGHTAAIPTLLVSALLGVNHMRSHRRPQVTKLPVRPEQRIARSDRPKSQPAIYPASWPLPLSTTSLYNFILIHSTIRTSPAMAAGVTDKLWDVADLVTLWESYEVMKANPTAA